MLNFDCQVRFRWEGGSIAIWDNRVSTLSTYDEAGADQQSTWHSATFDYDEERAGERASSVGEVPFFDPKSVKRSEGLAREGRKW